MFAIRTHRHPIHHVAGLLADLDRHFESQVSEKKPARDLQASSSFTPRIEYLRGDDRYTIYVEVPGFTDDELDIEVSQETLVIHGRDRKTEPATEATETADTKNEASSEIVQARRPFGRTSFTHKLRFPKDVDASNIKASLEHGILVKIGRAHV